MSKAIVKKDITANEPDLSTAEKEVLSSIVSTELERKKADKLLSITVEDGKVVVDFYPQKN